MRELYRSQAKAIMKKRGYFKNKWMQSGWRELTNAYPTNRFTGEKMGPYFKGKKRQHKKTDGDLHLFTYSQVI